MAVFKTQIQDIIGDFDDDVAINQFLTDGAKELIEIYKNKSIIDIFAI